MTAILQKHLETLQQHLEMEQNLLNYIQHLHQQPKEHQQPNEIRLMLQRLLTTRQTLQLMRSVDDVKLEPQATHHSSSQQVKTEDQHYIMKQEPQLSDTPLWLEGWFSLFGEPNPTTPLQPQPQPSRKRKRLTEPHKYQQSSPQHYQYSTSTSQAPVQQSSKPSQLSQRYQYGAQPTSNTGQQYSRPTSPTPSEHLTGYQPRALSNPTPSEHRLHSLTGYQPRALSNFSTKVATWYNARTSVWRRAFYCFDWN